MALLFSCATLALFLLTPSLLSYLTHPTTESPTPITIATSTAPDAFLRVETEAKSAIVYDLATRETLYEKNADTQLPLASLTKLLTVYAALAKLSPATPVTISARATRTEAPRVFTAGQTLSLSDLARLTLTASLNDGAAAIAEAAAEQARLSQSDLLAGAAASLDLSQTYAINGSGLDVNTAISGGYGSARDLARLAGALVYKFPEIAAATTESSTRATSAEGASFVAKNTDPMVGTFPRLLLSKTGYTDLAGGNLALVLDVGIAHPVAVVVLGSSKNARFTDGSALVAATLAHFANVASL
jgi:D-alanyl-D-alanine carboxypeptidase (penicillin-binding protein 5/6)